MVVWDRFQHSNTRNKTHNFVIQYYRSIPGSAKFACTQIGEPQLNHYSGIKGASLRLISSTFRPFVQNRIQANIKIIRAPHRIFSESLPRCWKWRRKNNDPTISMIAFHCHSNSIGHQRESGVSFGLSFIRYMDPLLIACRRDWWMSFFIVFILFVVSQRFPQPLLGHHQSDSVHSRITVVLSFPIVFKVCAKQQDCELYNTLRDIVSVVFGHRFPLICCVRCFDGSCQRYAESTMCTVDMFKKHCLHAFSKFSHYVGLSVYSDTDYLQ